MQSLRNPRHRIVDEGRQQREIEGLRAIAVLAVLVHHAFPELLPGGFAGVDVFFVISGYLIGSHLIRSIESGSFSVWDFYGRRVRRLFPALFVVLVGVWLGGLAILTPEEFEALGRHMVAASVFANNFLLASETGYFNAPAMTKPLLHLWSLAVEEQFYLVVPLLMLLSARWSGGPVRWLAHLAAGSLLWLLAMETVSSERSFFYLHARFWELGAGVLAARLVVAAPVTPCGSVRWEILAWAGVFALMSLLQLGDLAGGQLAPSWLPGAAGIVILLCACGGIGWLARTGRALPHLGWRIRSSGQLAGLAALAFIFVFGQPGEWPGPQTIVPVMGTVLVLAGGARGAGRWLGASLPFAMGQISYPLYLWHWPLLVGWQLFVPDTGWQGKLAPLAAAVVLAAATNVFIEEPARFGRFFQFRLPSPPPVRLLALSLAVTGALGGLNMATSGLPQRFPEHMRVLGRWDTGGGYREWRLGRCFLFLNNSAPFASECSPTRRPGRPVVMLWGDSHAAQLYPGFSAIAEDLHFDLAQWTVGSCPPTLTRLDGEGPACGIQRRAAWDRFQTYVPDVVVLSAVWTGYANTSASPAHIVESVGKTIERLRFMGVGQVLVVGPGPRWSAPLPGLLFREMVRRRTDTIPPMHPPLFDARLLDAAMRQQVQAAGGRYFSSWEALCSPSGCRTLVNTAAETPDLTFWDRDHLTNSGSNMVVGVMLDELRAALRDARQAASN